MLKIPEWGYGNFFTGPTFDSSGTIFQSARFEVPAAGTGCLANSHALHDGNAADRRHLQPREKQVSNTFETEVK